MASIFRFLSHLDGVWQWSCEDTGKGNASYNSPVKTQAKETETHLKTASFPSSKPFNQNK